MFFSRAWYVQFKRKVFDMMEVKNSQLDLRIQPAHNCKQNLIVIEETHSVNSSHNIVIARVHQCRMCKKKFESYDPNGLDKIF